jgi:membrane-bound serine protease (ClpP class)
MTKFSKLLLCFCLLWLTGSLFAQNNTAAVLTVKGGIGPAVAEYIDHGIQTAQNQHAKLIIIQLDTPGGLNQSMRAIVQSMLNSSLPVVTYVTPSGARAASAGTFMLYASQIAAMAPGTNLGAASPVALGGGMVGSKSKNNDSTMMSKVKNDAAAYIQSLAELHGRNARWAKLAVTKAASLSAKQALKKNVINFIAPDIPSLLQQMQGTRVKVGSKKITLATHKLRIHYVKPTWRNKVLTIIASPTIAYLLLLIGIYGIIFEFFNPGLIAPGVLGLVCVLFAVYGLHLLPVSYVGLLLLLAGIIMMVLELFVTSFGILAIAGIIAFFAGSFLLFDQAAPLFQVAMPVIIAITIVTAIFFLVLMRIAVKSQRRPVVSGQETLPGETGEVASVDDAIIIAIVEGERWQVKSDKPLSVGDQIKVLGRDGLVLTVQPIKEKE